MLTPAVTTLTRVEAAINDASRRRTRVIAAEELALALGVFCAGAVVLLLLGTGVLSLYWLIIFAVLGGSLALFRMRSRTISKYRIAQFLDHRFRLHDSLSTAWFLLRERPEQRGPLTDLLFSRADEVAADIQLAGAFPFGGRRAWAFTSCLGCAALTLFWVRYSTAQGLDLRPSLIRLPITATLEHIEKLVSPREHQQEEFAALAHQGEAGSPSPQYGRERQTQQDNGGPRGQPNGESGGQAQNNAGDPERNHAPADTPRDDRPNGGSSQPGSGAQAQQQMSKQTASRPKADGGNEQDAKQQGSSGLIDKMRDALSSLAAKARSNNEARTAGQSQASKSDAQKNSKSSQSSNANKPQDGSKQDANKQDGSEGEGKGQTAEKAQAAQGRSSDQSAEAGADSQSGVGRQDGNKKITEAQQLQALGKLQQIIGKRSADLTGEMTVEPSSGKQRLKTAYSNVTGRHSDSGGEINRDEVPVEDQAYVRAYMEQVRKQVKTGN